MSRIKDTAHDSASKNAKQLRNWLPRKGSADSDLLPELDTLVSRSRDLVRNNGIAAGALQTLVDNVVGTGFRLSATPDYRALGKDKVWAEEFAEKIEMLWRSWADTDTCDATRMMNFAGITSLVYKSSLLNGEALILPLWFPSRKFSTVLQVVEADRLSNPNNIADTEKLRGGIEIGAYGTPLAYWIQKYHDGDKFLLQKRNEWQRIPRRGVFGRLRVIHIHDKERTGQTRGKPVLTSVLSNFKMLGEYESSELQAAIVNAMIAAFVETPMSGDELRTLFDDSTEEYLKARNESNIKLQGGAIIPVFPGDKISSFTPSRPNTAYSNFVENVLRHIATGLNIPYELLEKDFSKTNYSSARAALLEGWRHFACRRRWLISSFLQPIYELFFEEVVAKGLIDAPEFFANKYAYTRSKWIGAGRGWIDPVKEVQAAKMRIELGISTYEDECAAQGLDWIEVFEQRSREKNKIKELGLSLNEAGAAIQPEIDITEETNEEEQDVLEEEV
ncbi:phage portal protein [Rickettsia endosymbiont of Cardiosporidium cionae]|uniref:phage portal protein n=1 Tax=Rickettsia endosymbiont of Cardiosporidium cionae TaxID=2777155 RepID=UPI0018956FCE|nr:phage portal protein [Rickettsia endosymbiont of Cardiosporidium cionae]KAF8818071.1 phage portal protein [Rickettsia endosymbiont of Cardiosporidium cionae]